MGSILPVLEATHDGIVASTDPARLDVAAIHTTLTESYWSEGISLDTVQRSMEHSICFGLYDGTAQIGFARVITDRATYGRLSDVYVLSDYRARGLGKWLVEFVLDHPDLQKLKVITLGTRDAHELYRRFGFRSPGAPDQAMERRHPDPFGRHAAAARET